MGFSDLFEVKVNAIYLGQQLLNVYHVEQLGAQTAETIANAYTNTVLPHVKNVQSERVLYQEITVRSFTDPLGFFTASLLGIVGNQAPAAPTLDLSPFLTLPIRLNRTRLDIRHGYKRYGGMTEGMVETGGLFVASIVTFVVGTLIPALLDDWGPGVCRLFVVKRIKVGTVYRMPISASEYVSYHPITASLTRMLTQNTRKIGIGA